MTLDTAVLADLAAKATPGEWHAEEWGPDATVLRPDGSRIIVGDALYHPESMRDARHIAAFSPDVAAALLAEVESLRKALRNLDTAATNYLNATEPKDYAVSALVNARREARAALVFEEGSR